MKFLSVLFIFIVFSMTGMVLADAAEEWADKHIETLDKELRLSTAQKDQIRPILIEEFNKRQEARAERMENRAEHSERKKGGGDNRENWYDKVHKRIGFILDDRQKKKLKKMEFSRDWSGDDQMKVLIERLKLTEEQQEKIGKVLETAGNDRKILMDEVRSGSRDRSDIRQAMKSINDETDKNIEAELTPEQIKEYQKIKDERRQQMEQRRGNRGDGQDRRMGGGR